MPCKPVQDRLPAITLPPFPAVGFALKGDAQGHASFAVSAPRAGAVAKGAWDQRMQSDCGAASGRIKAEATVFGFHPCPDLPARRQIDRSPRPVPVMGRSVPLAKAAGAPWARRTLALALYHGFSGDRRGDFRASRSVCLDRQACRMRHAGVLRGADARQDRRRCRTFPACQVGTSPPLTVARTVPV